MNVLVNAPFALDEDATWVGMLAQTTESLPFALICADMFEPGAKLVHVNAAFERLTGFAAEEAVGTNCRFLQGEETEQEEVQKLVEAMRKAEPTQVHVHGVPAI